jgi:hypothetical protein
VDDKQAGARCDAEHEKARQPPRRSEEAKGQQIAQECGRGHVRVRNAATTGTELRIVPD